MKSNFSSLIFNIVAALIGSAAIIILQPLYDNFTKRQQEGTLQVEISKSNPNAADDAQAYGFGVRRATLYLKHKGGPSLRGVTIKVKTASGFDHLEYIAEDDKSEILFSEDMESIRIDIPELRKHSTNAYNLFYFDDSSITWSAQISEGRLFTENDSYSIEGWLTQNTINSFRLPFLVVMVLISFPLARNTHYLRAMYTMIDRHYTQSIIVIIVFSSFDFLNTPIIIFLFISNVYLYRLAPALKNQRQERPTPNA